MLHPPPPDVPTCLVCLYHRRVSAEPQVHGQPYSRTARKIAMSHPFPTDSNNACDTALIASARTHVIAGYYLLLNVLCKSAVLLKPHHRQYSSNIHETQLE